MNRTDRELLQDALNALELWSSINAKDLVITQKIRARLAEKEDEPAKLSDEEILDIDLPIDRLSDKDSFMAFARAIESAVLVKNQ